MDPDDETNEVFENDYDMITLRQHATEEFLDTFKEGVNCYLSGDWSAAKTFLEKSDEMMKTNVPALGGDGPSLTLLSYMKDRDYQAPADWKGFRPLTSK